MDYPDNWNQLSKRERKQFKRDLKRKQQIQAANKQKYTKYTYWLIALIVVGGLVGWVVKTTSTPLPGEKVPTQGNQHIESLNASHEVYNSNPPTSGSHVGGHADWGIHDQPIPDELQLHNLEDGGVMVQYNCDPEDQLADSELTLEGTEDTLLVDEHSPEATLSAEIAELPDNVSNSEVDCSQLISQLTEVVEQYNDKVVLAPYPKLDTRIALTAWNRIDKFDDFDSERIHSFIKKYKGIDHH